MITLNALAPASATAYQLDMEPATLGFAEVLDGYGFSGTGVDGYSGSLGSLQAGENEFLETGNQYQSGWSSNLLIGQFYDSTDTATNALNCSTKNHSGCKFSPFSASDEVDISPGDSGGPAFEDVGGTYEIVGVNDFDACITSNGTTCNMPPAEWSQTFACRITRGYIRRHKRSGAEQRESAFYRGCGTAGRRSGTRHAESGRSRPGLGHCAPASLPARLEFIPAWPRRGDSPAPCSLLR